MMAARPRSVARALCRPLGVLCPRRPASTVPVELHSGTPQAFALSALLADFKAPIRYAFAYGSGVFPQRGASRGMTDLILGVTHPHHWHSINMYHHPRHYAALPRLLGSATVAAAQRLPAGVWFNPYVEINGVMVKYGVVAIDKLCMDLTEWESLYLAGRMHKPIQILRHDSRVSLHQENNLCSALRVAFLQLPERFTRHELYMTIAGLSYQGDFRMRGFEHPNKLRNVVDAQMPQFEYVYSDLTQTAFADDVHWGETIEVDASPRARARMLAKLPPLFLARVRRRAGASVDISLADLAALPPETLRECVHGALRDTVAGPALAQAVKGVFSAGLLKSIRYAGAKLSKSLGGKPSLPPPSK